MKRKKVMGLFLFLGLLSITMGVSIAFFNYTRTGTENVLAVGRINFITNQTNTITLQNIFPIDSDDVDTDTTNVGIFNVTIRGDTDYNEGIEYLVSSVDSELETTSGKKIPVSLDFTINNLGASNDNYFTARESKNATIYKILNEEINDDKKILVGYIKPNTTLGTAEGINGSITIKAYLDKDKIGISDTYDGTESDNMGTTNEWARGRTILTTTEWNALQTNGISFKVRIEANEGIWVEDTNAVSKVRKSITEKINATTNACNPIWIDDMGTANDEADDITYFSGTNNCVDMNYVWYSGKLWRITAIYPDGAMKMVTDEMITSLFWNDTIEYDGSWVYQWLNEDFYDTLVNPSDILINNATWNYSTDGSSPPVRPQSIGTQKNVSAPVGLLNSYEYYNAYRNNDASTNYLNIGYYWWLITPTSSSTVRTVGYDGYFGGGCDLTRVKYGIRPSIILKSGVELIGNGTKSNPYTITGDKDNPTSSALISSRSVGEYVKFDNDIYRIVETDKTLGTTKLIRVDYLENSGNVIRKSLSSTIYFGKSTNTNSDTYLDYYLNNTWYNGISLEYKNMLVDDTYYLGMYEGDTGYNGLPATNYKVTICNDSASNLNSITTKNCTKYTSSDVDKIFVGKVGLLRAGEMFSTQIGHDYQLPSTGRSASESLWLITPASDSHNRTINYLGYLDYSLPTNNDFYAIRPTITLKSGIRITGGTGYVGGDTNSPFEISE